jgi:hypothetical protein
MVKDGNTNEHQGESPINKVGTFWWQECPKYEGGYVTCEISTVGKQKTKQRYAANTDAFSLKVIEPQSKLKLKAGGEDFEFSNYYKICMECSLKAGRIYFVSSTNSDHWTREEYKTRAKEVHTCLNKTNLAEHSQLGE